MKLVFLGTSAAQPTEKRGLSCICLEREGEILMFDAGEAAQIAYMKSGLGWNKKMKLFVTHLHGDHCVGILGLLQTMSMQNRTEPLEIFGPKGIDEFLGANIKVLNFGLPFSILINIEKENLILNEDIIKKLENTIKDINYGLKEKEKNKNSTLIFIKKQLKHYNQLIYFNKVDTYEFRKIKYFKEITINNLELVDFSFFLY